MNTQANKPQEFKVDVMVVRTAIFMAGTVQAITTKAARADGYGRDFFGFMRTVYNPEKI